MKTFCFWTTYPSLLFVTKYKQIIFLRSLVLLSGYHETWTKIGFYHPDYKVKSDCLGFVTRCSKNNLPTLISPTKWLSWNIHKNKILSITLLWMCHNRNRFHGNGKTSLKWWKLFGYSVIDTPLPQICHLVQANNNLPTLISSTKWLSCNTDIKRIPSITLLWMSSNVSLQWWISRKMADQFNSLRKWKKTRNTIWNLLSSSVCHLKTRRNSHNFWPYLMSNHVKQTSKVPKALKTIAIGTQLLCPYKILIWGLRSGFSEYFCSHILCFQTLLGWIATRNFLVILTSFKTFYSTTWFTPKQIFYSHAEDFVLIFPLGSQNLST